MHVPERFSSLCAFLYFCLLSLLLCKTVFFLLNLGSSYLIIPFISYSCSFPYQQIYSPQSPQIIFYECKSNHVCGRLPKLLWLLLVAFGIQIRFLNSPWDLTWPDFCCLANLILFLVTLSTYWSSFSFWTISAFVLESFHTWHSLLKFFFLWTANYSFVFII